MGILTRPLLHAQQRFDLEDLNVLLSSLRTDSKFWTRRFLSDESYIIKGFTIAQTYIGQSTALVNLTEATLINAPATQDFSWYTAELSPTPITLPVGSSGLQAGRNYVELELDAEDGVPLVRAFWDPAANSGEGTEFTNEVNTVTELSIGVAINQTAFNSGDPDKIPLAIIDIDGSSGLITGIQDQRNLFFRLGTPDDPTANYLWGSQTEPTTELVFVSASATPYQTGETVDFTSGASATVVVGGTNNITVKWFTNNNYFAGDVVVGATSGSSATLSTYYEDFTGADKDIGNFRDMFAALATEIKAVKGTDAWFEEGLVLSLPSLLSYFNAQLVPRSAGARFHWSGTNLSITDDMTSGQATSDVMASLRVLGNSYDLDITRQDGSGGSATIGIADGYVLYIELPRPLANRTYSEAGSGVTNFRVVARADYIESDTNYFLGIREGNKFIMRGLGEFEAGEKKQISDETTKGTLAFLGAVDETDETPPYTTTPDPSLSNQFSSSDSLTQAISINAANINDIVSGVQKNYYEPLNVVTGAPADDNEVTGPVSSGSNLTLPLDSRDSNNPKEYLVGNGALMVFLNGQHLTLGEDYAEVGLAGSFSDEIQILQDLAIGDLIEFRLMIPETFGTAGISQPYFVNYITGQNGSQIPVGNLYNVGTDKLSIYRNGLFMLNTLTFGDLVDRYQEPNTNSVALSLAASPSTVFAFINREDPAPSVTYQTGVTGTTLTVPSYAVGSERLMLYKNGVLLTKEAGAPADLTYSETSSTTVELDTAANIDDVFAIYNAGSAPTWRETLTGSTATVITIPNGQSYTMGDEKLLVFRNGLLILNSASLGAAADRYQETTSTSITLGDPLVASDVLEFVYLG